MVGADAFIKAIAALVSATFALLVLAGDPRRASNRRLALFLGLVAGNQIFETLRAISTDTGWDTIWYRLATICAALDPLALYLFAACFPERNALDHTGRVLAVAVPSAILLLVGSWRLEDGAFFEANNVLLTRLLFESTITLFTAIVYTVVLVHVARSIPRPSSPYLVGVLALAALPTWGFAGAVLGELAAWPSRGAIIHAFASAARLAFLLVAVGTVVLVLKPRVPDGHKRALLAGALGVVPFVYLFQDHTVLRFLAQDLIGPQGSPASDSLYVLGNAGAAVRLTAMGLLLSGAVLRDDAFGLKLRARRRAARILVGLVGAIIALVLVGALSVLSRGTLVARPIDVLILLGAIGLSQGFRRLIDEVAWRAYGVPLSGDPQARVEAYRLAARQAISDGAEAESRLAALRAELEIEPNVARAIEMAEHAAAASTLTPGRSIAGRYKLTRMLAQGGHGRVFLARDERLGRDVVVKEITRVGDSASAVEEARVAGQLNHPNVVTVHDVVLNATTCLIVSEHAPGGSLADRARDAPPSRNVALRWLTDVLAGLAHVHARGVVHRDLKPSNVLLDAEGRAKISDFGIARMGREDITRVPGVAVGTPAYMAPEQQRGEVANAASDVYAFGLLARRLAPDGLSPELDAVVERALREDRNLRWQDAREMEAAWRDALRATQQGIGLGSDELSIR